MIDLHAHILPGLDDGSIDLADALAMARIAVSTGTRVLAATPHIDRRFQISPAAVADRLAGLRRSLHSEEIALEVVQGGELAINRIEELDDTALAAVTLGSGRWLLLECPFSAAAPVELAIDHLQARGFRVLVAHPERCPRFIEDPGRTEALVARGALLQLTSGSLAGDFGDPARRAAQELVERGLAHVLASDAHGATRRPPDVLRGAAALRERYGDVSELLTSMTELVPRAILSGQGDLELPRARAASAASGAGSAADAGRGFRRPAPGYQPSTSPLDSPELARPPSKTRVLYVERTGLIGGGERSLLGLLDGTAGRLDRILACPSGPLQSAAVSRDVPVVTIPETAGSLRLHPWHTAASLGSMGAAALAIWREARRLRVDLLHANSIRAGLTCAPAARRLGIPLVVHVRDRLPPSALTTAVRSAVFASASAVVAISRYVAEEFDPHGRARRLRVIDNPLDLGRFDPSLLTRAHARVRVDVPPGVPLIGIIGQLTPWKGQDDAIRALAAVRATHREARMVIVGEPKFVARSTRFDNWAFVRGLHEEIRELGLGWSVSFLGEREDIPEIVRALDVLLVPSWEEPFGRTVIEAMAMGTPVVATSVGGPREVITDGVDGRLIAPRDPAAWGAAIGALLDDGTARALMGERARATVTARFGLRPHADAVIGLYEDVLRPLPV